MYRIVQSKTITDDAFEYLKKIPDIHVLGCDPSLVNSLSKIDKWFNLNN